MLLMIFFFPRWEIFDKSGEIKNKSQIQRLIPIELLPNTVSGRFSFNIETDRILL